MKVLRGKSRKCVSVDPCCLVNIHLVPPGDLLAKPLYQRVESRQTAAECVVISQLRLGLAQSVPLCGTHCQLSSPIVADLYDSVKPQLHE